MPSPEEGRQGAGQPPVSGAGRRKVQLEAGGQQAGFPQEGREGREGRQAGGGLRSGQARVGGGWEGHPDRARAGRSRARVGHPGSRPEGTGSQREGVRREGQGQICILKRWLSTSGRVSEGV